jgi:hypothetical protein
LPKSWFVPLGRELLIDANGFSFVWCAGAVSAANRLPILLAIFTASGRMVGMSDPN